MGHIVCLPKGRIMRRFLAVAAAIIICIIAFYGLKRVDVNTKKIAGFLDSNVFFDIDREDGKTVVTILNEKIRLR